MHPAQEPILVFSRDQAREFDVWAMQSLGIPGAVLMENAGRSAAEFALEQLGHGNSGKACILCGQGNNGGDGLVVARHLLNHDVPVTTVLCADPSKLSGDAAMNLQILQRLGHRIELLQPDAQDLHDRLARLAQDAELLVDAILGTGLAGRVRSPLSGLIDQVNALGIPILAIDIPSGLDCDTGLPLGVAIRAEWTVTFVATKKGFLSPQARQYTGQVIVAGIGVSPGLRQET